MTTTTTRGLAVAVTAALSVTAWASFAPPSQAAPTLTLVAASADGVAFDVDEYGAGDITVQVTKGAGTPVNVPDDRDLAYFWRVTPFDTATPAVRVPATGVSTATTDVKGAFAVDFPAGAPSGSYTLVASLKAGTSGATATPNATLLTLAAGQASVDFTADSPLLATAGVSTKVTGSLALENGTALPGRTLDLSFTRGTDGTDPEADAGFTPLAPAVVPGLTATATTTKRGTFTTTVVDPAEPGQGTELGGALTVSAGTDIGDAGATGTLDVDLVSIQPPTGSTFDLGGLGSGRPGEVLHSGTTLVAPDDTFDADPATAGVQGDPGNAPDPVIGQVVTLSTDHGFFTSGEPTPSVVGARKGDLVQSGTGLTALSDDYGNVDFKLGIARDSGFDANGLLEATVTATAGSLSDASMAHWSTANPLNGAVSIVLSPEVEQQAAVDPSLNGNRTYFEVLSTDQFGNPVAGQSIDLSYSGDLDDWDYSDDFVTSDFDTDGDIWVVDYQPGDIHITGTWQDAPTTVFTDPSGSTVSSVADAVGMTTASFYALDFDESTFRIRSSARSTAAVGSTVTETVTVTDQLGNPVRGYQVQFYRYGPESSSGEPRATVTTNARGEASYTFLGAKAGTARITARISNGLSTTTVADTVRFGAPVRASLAAGRGTARTDLLTVRASKIAAGVTVVLYRLDGSKRTVVGRGRLDKTGSVSISVRDRNGSAKSVYLASVAGTASTAAVDTNQVSCK